MRGNVAPPFPSENTCKTRLGIWGRDQERPAGDQKIPAVADELPGLMEVFDQIHGDDRVEALGGKTSLGDGLLTDV